MRTPGQRDEMPKKGNGWHRVYAGPGLGVFYHPNRQPEGREPDGIIRKSIDVALAGNRKQALRFDPFSEGAHYHIGPVAGRDDQIPLEVADGQTPLEAALALFTNAKRFREMLIAAEPGAVIGHDFLVPDELLDAAAQIRRIDARAATA